MGSDVAGEKTQAMTTSHSRESDNPKVTRWIPGCIIIVAWGVYLWGIQMTLPFTPEVDEPTYVTRAVNIAATGNLNPGWFGHPGSTVIYPLAVLFRIWYTAMHRGMLFHPDPNLQVAFSSSPSEFYLLGRFLTVAFALTSLPLVYQIGRWAFGEREGLIGSWFSILCPIAVMHAKIVRTDSAAVFFGMLSLWLCLKLYDQPTTKNQIMAGMAIGLGIATRYFMVTLVSVLLAVDVLVLRRHGSQPQKPKGSWVGICVGFVAIIAAFSLSTPYFFLDFGTASENIRVEARSTHLGADGLSPAGNFWWYLAEAIPNSITWPQMALAAIGVILVVWRRHIRQILLLGFVIVFLVGISLSSLHWQRWLIQILPLLALLAADALNATTKFLSGRFGFEPPVQRGLILSILLLVSACPAYQLALLDIRGANPNTRVLAREWLIQNLPPGSRIAQEWYTAPLAGTDFIVFEQNSVATNRTLEDYYRDGYRYIVVSNSMYGRYLAEPDRYPSEVAFYQELFAKGHLLQQFEPSNIRGGPIIRIYELTTDVRRNSE